MFNVNKFNSVIAAAGDNAQEAARIMGIHYVTLYRKMSGKSDFLRAEMEDFCKHYKANPNDIFFANEFTETQNS